MSVDNTAGPVPYVRRRAPRPARPVYDYDLAASRVNYDPYTGLLSRVGADGEEENVAGPLDAQERVELMRDLAAGTGHRVVVGEQVLSSAHTAFLVGRNSFRASSDDACRVWEGVCRAEKAAGAPSPDGVMAVLVGVWGVPESTVAALEAGHVRPREGGGALECARAPLGWWPVDTFTLDRLRALEAFSGAGRLFPGVGSGEEVAARVGALCAAACGTAMASGELFTHTHRILSRMPSSPLWDPVEVLGEWDALEKE